MVLSWDPVETDQEGRPIQDVSYEVFVRVNDAQEQRFGPVTAPWIELPVHVAPCDRVRVQVQSVHAGERSPRSMVLEQRVLTKAGAPCAEAARTE